MGSRGKITALALIAIICTALFLFTQLTSWEYALPRRGKIVLAITVTGAAIAFSTVIFQTITNNRILTPSIIGLDSLYLLIQTFLVFLFGSTSVVVMNSNINFIIAVGGMVLFALVLYKVLFTKGGQNIFFLLLIGIVLGTLFESLSTFLQVIIDPNEFLTIQNRMFASFNNVNTDLLTLSILAFVIVAIYCFSLMKYLDVLSLGRDHAINLGVDYDYVVKRLLIVIAILVSIATALVGPMTFLGLLVANVTYEFMKTYKHKYLLLASVFVGIIALVGGQYIVERVFHLSTPLSVIVNFVGGLYFLYLLLKESRKW